MSTNPDRFLGRAAVYAAARPPYPAALGEWLTAEGLLRGNVADLGAGTGLFTRLLLSAGAAQVDAVEPNPEMRAELEAALAAQVASGTVRVHAGTSEATGLPDASLDLITAAQAAHWFAPEPTLRELRRVLRPGGRVLLVWNDWRGVDAPLNRAYGEVVAQFTEADVPVLATRVPEAELPGLLPGGFEKRLFDHAVPFTRERLRALAGSVSYLPSPGDPVYPDMAAALDRAFGDPEGGEAPLVYRTHAYLGRIED
ncbi:class I SAM-dependent methyltransferase [Deinococcus sp. Leaf326]|uniref:class I SAM-dependent methyltransferase n=1 Tax=Deinococcus sp. Leaf326 TaxID=1736338 RepID=UPI0006FBB649|nr:class I SAM-dependent methyltransferase [Deinococcus sp. Leaf326]KQR40653.1 methyltransferase type 11 [Deinococcus sp. Leaf326]